MIDEARRASDADYPAPCSDSHAKNNRAAVRFCPADKNLIELGADARSRLQRQFRVCQIYYRRVSRELVREMRHFTVFPRAFTIIVSDLCYCSPCQAICCFPIRVLIVHCTSVFRMKCLASYFFSLWQPKSNRNLSSKVERFNSDRWKIRARWRREGWITWIATQRQLDAKGYFVL